MGSHAFFLQLQDSDPELFGPLSRGDLDAAQMSDAERALMRFVEIVTRHAYRTTDEEVETLRAAGWSDPQIAECVYITALFAFFNRVADAFGLEDPNYFEHPPKLPGAETPNPEETAE